MASVCQNLDQKATVKKSKIHRAQTEMSRKIIAFEEILEANQAKSCREVTRLLNVPNSTIMIWKRFPKKEKEQHTPLLKNLQQKLRYACFSEEVKEALMRRGKEAAEIFQRSSSCVEGRNGALSLLMHRFHYLSEKTLKVLSVVHN